MKKLQLIALLGIMLAGGAAFVSSVSLGIAQTGTQVYGAISSNTKWTKANNPYNLTDDITVANNTTLTIEPGVFVYLNNHHLWVDGTLSAVGTATDPITFTVLLPFPTLTPSDYSQGGINFSQSSTNWNEQTHSGCIIENAVIKGGVIINIINSSPKIDQNSVDYFTMYIRGGSPTISNNTLKGSRIEVGGGAPTISNNTIVSTGTLTSYYGVIFWGSNTALVTDNFLSGCGEAIAVYSGSPTIQRNFVTTSKSGIQLLGDVSPLILNNTISGNVKGITIQMGSKFPSPTIINNNIQDNSKYNVYIIPGFIEHSQVLLSSVGNILNASYNWWGTVDEAKIGQTIFDSKNDSLAGNVTFVPFLTAPNPEAPALTAPPTPSPSPAPTPSPTSTPSPTQTPVPSSSPTPAPSPSIPEFPAWIVLPVLAIATLLVSYIIKKTRVGQAQTLKFT